MSEQMDCTAPGNEPLQPCSATFKVTLFRSKKLHQVLFLEAGKEFVDALFGFLVLPLGSVLHALSQGVQVKPLNGISGIFESVDSSFLLVDTDTLVQPRLAALASCFCRSGYGDLAFQRDLEAAKIFQPFKKKLVGQPECHKRSNQKCTTLSSIKNQSCDSCTRTPVPFTFGGGPLFAQEKDTIKVSASSEGFVKENITFIVTDKLEIMPSNSTASMSLLRKCGVASLSDVESTETTVKIIQVLQLLSSALKSSTCLTDVFEVLKK